MLVLVVVLVCGDGGVSASGGMCAHGGVMCVGGFLEVLKHKRIHAHNLQLCFSYFGTVNPSELTHWVTSFNALALRDHLLTTCFTCNPMCVAMLVLGLCVHLITLGPSLQRVGVVPADQWFHIVGLTVDDMRIHWAFPQHPDVRRGEKGKEGGGE